MLSLCEWSWLALLHHFRWVKGNSEVACLVHPQPSWAELRAVSPDLAVNFGASQSDETNQLSLSVRRASVWWKWFIWSSDTGWYMLAGEETGVNPTIWRVGTRLHREQREREREAESKTAYVKDMELVLNQSYTAVHQLSKMQRSGLIRIYKEQSARLHICVDKLWQKNKFFWRHHLKCSCILVMIMV